MGKIKKLFYLLFAAAFYVGRLTPVKKNTVALISPHNASFNDSLGCLRTELEASGNFRFIEISHSDLGKFASALKFFTVKAFRLAGAGLILLNDNFMPMSMLHFSKRAAVVQLWHAEGAFKKFGLDIEQPEDIRRSEIGANKRLTHVICTGRKVAPIYASAFGVAPERVLPLGSPRTDSLFGRDAENMRARFDSEHPECRGKKLVLYAPTFRDDRAADSRLLDSFDFSAFKNALGGEYALLVRLHPQIHAAAGSMEGAVDMTAYPDVGDLVCVCDVLITDYSSICMDFALLGKPCVFYAFDKADYLTRRPVYFDYDDYVPGRVVKTFHELLHCLAVKDFATEKISDFISFNFDSPGPGSTKKVAEYIMKILSEH